MTQDEIIRMTTKPSNFIDGIRYCNLTKKDWKILTPVLIVAICFVIYRIFKLIICI